jgi:hypothetical protein
MNTAKGLLSLFLICMSVALVGQNGYLLAWGRNGYNQCNVPEGNDYSAVAAGGLGSLALKADGSLLAWGNNEYGQCVVPEGNNYTAISAGTAHFLALRSDGSLVSWGSYHNGPYTPSGNDFVSIDCGWEHCLALSSDGAVIGWGDDGSGQDSPPSGIVFTHIAAGGWHSLGIQADGSLAAWGWNNYGQCDVPGGNDYLGVAAGGYHSTALKTDGSLVSWGSNDCGQSNVPSGTDFTFIDAGGDPDGYLMEQGLSYSVAMRNDGSVGDNFVVAIVANNPSGIGDDVSSTSPVLKVDNFPNPFNPTTSITYDLPETGQVTIDIYNARGQFIRQLVNSTQPSGKHSVVWNGEDSKGRITGSGLYLCRVSAGNQCSRRHIRLQHRHIQAALSSHRLALELHRAEAMPVALPIGRFDHVTLLIGGVHVVEEQGHEVDLDVAQLALADRLFLE